MAESQKINIWTIRLDRSFNVQGRPFQLKMLPSNNIDDMAELAMTLQKLNCAQDAITILKIKEPFPIPLQPQRTHNYFTRASASLQAQATAQATSPFDVFLGKLKTQAEYDSPADVLQPDELVSEHFRDNAVTKEGKALLQAIVLHPVLEAKKRKAPSDDAPQGQKVPRILHLSRLVSGSSPSETLGVHGVNLRKEALLGRPGGHYAFPVSLYSTHLATLQDKLSRLDVSPEEARHLFEDADKYRASSRLFLAAAIQDHESESSRWKSSRPFFDSMFGQHAIIDEYKIVRSGMKKSNTGDIPMASADACVVTTLGDSSEVPRIIVEVRKEKGVGDPVAQCTKEYAEIVYGLKEKKFFHSTYFPTIFICIEGHILEICTAVSIENVVVNSILKLEMQDSVHSNDLIEKLARMASALAECSVQLNAEYLELAEQDSSRNPRLSCYPQPTLTPSEVSNGPPLPTLEFEGGSAPEHMLPDPSPSLMRSPLIAIMQVGDGEPIEVVVKFVTRYNREAHVILANENLAPKLYHCRRVLGGMTMVIMEYLEGKRMEDFGSLPSSVFTDLEQAISKLHENGYVHGDLRAANVIIDTSGKNAKVLDFDWCAKHSEGRYPSTINKDALRDEWHSDVDADGLMKKEHDCHALNYILKRKYTNQP